MKKFIYTAVITVFSVSILPFVYAGSNGEGLEVEKIGVTTKEIPEEILESSPMPPKSLGDAMAVQAYEEFARMLEQKNAKKKALVEQIREDKERSDSLVDELIAKPALLYGGLTVTYPTGVKISMDVNEDGTQMIKKEIPPVSPYKVVRRKSPTSLPSSQPVVVDLLQAVAAEKLVRTKSGNWLDVLIAKV